jgi:hypothetical protein
MVDNITTVRHVVALLDWMKEYNMSPDVVTCTLLLSSLSTEANIANGTLA